MTYWGEIFPVYKNWDTENLTFHGFWGGVCPCFLYGVLKPERCLTKLQRVWFSSWEWGPGDIPSEMGIVVGVGALWLWVPCLQDQAGQSPPGPDPSSSLVCLLQSGQVPAALLEKVWAQNQEFGQSSNHPPPLPCAKQNFNVLPISLFSTHKEKRKKLIIIYKRSSFQTNGKAFNADIYFFSTFKWYLFKCRFFWFHMWSLEETPFNLNVNRRVNFKIKISP